MAITTMTQLPPEVRTYFDRMLLTLARPYYIYDLFAQKRTIPLNSGDQMVFARYGTLSAATIPLTDGQGLFTHLKSDLIDLELLAA